MHNHNDDDDLVGEALGLCDVKKFNMNNVHKYVVLEQWWIIIIENLKQPQSTSKSLPPI